MYNYLPIFVGSLMLSVVATPVVRRVALRSGFVDHPGPRKIHLAPIPLLGGLAIYAAVVLSVIFMIDGSARSQILGIFGGATLLLIVGLLDDRGLLHHQVKLMIAMPVAAAILIASGIHSMLVSSLFDLGSPRLSLLADYALTFFWIVGITAAFSILDHMDGLCVGTAAIASGFFLLFAVPSGQLLVGPLAAAMLGACLGFLIWNFNPARIFMGDGGAMFLGFIMATLGLKLRVYYVPINKSWMIPVLILAIPIFDTTLVTISRVRRGLVPFASPGKDHAAHRLVDLGLSHRQAVLAMYALGLTGGLLALLVSRVDTATAYLIAGIFAASALLAIAWLERAMAGGLSERGLTRMRADL